MQDFYALFSPTPAWTVTLISFVLLIVVLYMGRTSAHNVINALFRLLYSNLRIGARSVAIAERKLNERNREVLIALGKEQAERELSREFFRINKFVERDLGGYPNLQRQIHEQITAIDEDYQQSGEIPPPSPEWMRAVESIGKLQLKDNGNDLTKKIFHAAEDQHRDVLQTYRQNIAERHGILKGIAPYWRKLSNSVDSLGLHFQELIKRAKKIDAQMERYEEITAQSERAERMLKASAMTQFCIAALVVAIAMAGAFFNFHLIAYPMSEMVDASNRIGGVRVSDIAALVLIFIEITMGIFLLEALHVTRMFPIIGSMDDRMRVKGIWLVGTILITMALMESGLAFMRDVLAADNRALQASLTGVEPTQGDATWITLAVNMGMGFILPLALTVVAIPLEYLLHTGRTVFGMLLELALRLLALTLRILANTLKHLGSLLVNLYDIIILVPLWFEQMIRSGVRKQRYDHNPNTDELLLEHDEYLGKEGSK